MTRMASAGLDRLRQARDGVRRTEMHLRQYVWRRTGGPPGKIVLCFRGRNWGDALNVPLARMLSGSRTVSVDLRTQYPLLDSTIEDTYLLIGSTLQYAGRRTHVLGAGFMSEKSRVLAEPKRLYAGRTRGTCSSLRAFRASPFSVTLRCSYPGSFGRGGPSDTFSAWCRTSPIGTTRGFATSPATRGSS